MIDVNVSLGHWPSQKFEQNTPGKLAAHLESEGISRALVTALDAVFFPDPDICNRTLFASLKSRPSLVPVPTVNPILTGWRSALRESPSRAVKIYPNYHNYSLSSDHVHGLMQELSETCAALMIAVRMEDERGQHPLCKAPGVPSNDIISLANRWPQVPIVCLCANFSEAVKLTEETGNIHVDTAFAECEDTLVALRKKVPAERILFGSHTPFLVTRAAVMKVTASTVSKQDLAAITVGNAGRLFGIHG